METRLANDPATGTFCRGDDITVADIFLVAIVVIMRVFGIRVPDIPTVEAIVARCDALPAFRDAAPMRQPRAPSTR